MRGDHLPFAPLTDDIPQRDVIRIFKEHKTVPKALLYISFLQEIDIFPEFCSIFANKSFIE